VGEVSDLVAGQVVPAWSPSRLNARYVPALRLAELVLRGASFDLSRGAVRTSGFMVNMPTVFEDFVTVALGEALVGHSGGTAVLQDQGWRLDEGGAVRLRPDLVWYPGPSGRGVGRGGVKRGGRGGFGAPGVVVDAKYKAEKPSGFPNADIYQLLGYCTALGLTAGHLIYAKGNEDGCSYRIPAAEVTITAHTLDLEAAPRDLLGQVGALAGRILGQARSNAS
ncbi:MAG: 5-methylcytosine-specific restriction enzyme subunit McrC, partial [Actinomycetota bacterium]|nr:5-methylcytosine-specific restriction enzyme subunit McrC [Actinomycetota bacterium]